MSDQPVTPDREAMIERARAFFHMDIARGLVLDDDMVRLADALLPPLTEALDRARQQGWRDHWEYVIRGGGSDLGEPGDLDQLRARLDPWSQCRDVDPFTGQPDHIHGDSCDAEECCE